MVDLYDLAIGTRVEVSDEFDQPYLAEFLGCIVDRRTDKDMAIVRPKGWERKLVAVHAHQIEITDRW